MLKDSNKCYTQIGGLVGEFVKHFPKEFVSKFLKQSKATKPSNVSETRVDVEDAKNPPIKKHSKSPKAIQNANTLKIGATSSTQANLAKKGVGTKSSSRF
jgi:hypothetical protein